MMKNVGVDEPKELPKVNVELQKDLEDTKRHSPRDLVGEIEGNLVVIPYRDPNTIGDDS